MRCAARTGQPSRAHGAGATLAGQVRVARDLTVPSRREVRVARLLAELRLSGIDLPAPRCQDCDGPADPLTSYRQVVRGKPCAREAWLCPPCALAAESDTLIGPLEGLPVDEAGPAGTRASITSGRCSSPGARAIANGNRAAYAAGRDAARR